MADEIDRMNDIAEFERDSLIRTAAGASATIPEGIPGVCKECQIFSRRLVVGRCAPCRDSI